tara:strand:+ start:3171 stop:3698 length:528 start_codon:yes stop_codon:yes gene_type:complete
MKLIENALDVAMDLSYQRNIHSAYQMPHWEKLMEYTDDDWDALQTLRKKYLKETPMWGLSQENYIKGLERGYFGYEYNPNHFKKSVFDELSHRKQEKKKTEIRVMVENAFTSITNAVYIYDNILFPVMRLNTEEQELEDKINRVNKLRDDVGALVKTTANHNGNLLFAVNELLTS